jgi:hypothetical protein
MGVQSIALPNVSGTARDQEIPVVPAAVAVPADAARRVSLTPAVVPVLVATQAAWITLLGYGVVHYLF